MSIGIPIRVWVGQITKSGILQGQDADQRTVRDLIQYNPRWLVPANYHQLATQYEIHNMEGATLTMEAGSEYIQDEGSVLKI